MSHINKTGLYQTMCMQATLKLCTTAKNESLQCSPHVALLDTNFPA